MGRGCRVSVALRQAAVFMADCGTACSLPLRGRWPSAARSDEVVSLAPGMARLARPLSLQYTEPAVSNAGSLRRLLGNSGFFLFLFPCSFLLRLGCRDIPAQGLTPPLHPRKGFHPLTRFRRRFPLEDYSPARRTSALAKIFVAFTILSMYTYSPAWWARSSSSGKAAPKATPCLSTLA